MDESFLGKNQRSEKACMKQTLKMILLLLVCVWLLYQINQSRINGTERFFGGEITTFEEHGIVLLGRKVMMIPSSWLNQIPLPNSEEEHYFAAESVNGTEKKSRRTESDEKVRENHEKYSENDKKEEETERFYRFKDENGVPPEEGYEIETEHCGGNGSGFGFSRKEIIRFAEMNTHEETVMFSGDVNDVEGNSESTITHSDASGISVGYSVVL